MEKYRDIVRMNEAPTRPLHLHRLVRPVLNEDGELDFVGVEEGVVQKAHLEQSETEAEERILQEFKPRVATGPRIEVREAKAIRGVAPSAIRLNMQPTVRDNIELSLTRMIAEYRRMWWGDEDRADAERIAKARQERELAEAQARQQEKEDQNDWDFLYSTNEEDFEI